MPNPALDEDNNIPSVAPLPKPKIFNQDDAKAQSFFTNVLATHGITTPDPNLAFVTVNHFVSTLPHYLGALAQIGRILFIVPKASYTDERIKKQIQEMELPIAEDTKESINKNPQDIINKIKQEVRQNEKVIIIDIGGYFAPCVRLLAQDEWCQEKIIGIVEDTENGHQKYEKVINDAKHPIVSVARSILKETEDYNVGKSVVRAGDTLLRDDSFTLTERLKTAVVLGFGKIGRSAAIHLREMGVQQIVVYDTNPILRMKAASMGFRICDASTRDEWISKADLIYSATGNHALTSADFKRVKDMVFIGSVTSADDEMDLTWLNETAEISNEKHTTRYYLKETGKTINFLAAGNAANFVYGAINGPYIFSVQAELMVSAIKMSRGEFPLEPKIQENTLDDKKRIAEIWLQAFEESIQITKREREEDEEKSKETQNSSKKIKYEEIKIIPKDRRRYAKRHKLLLQIEEKLSHPSAKLVIWGAAGLGKTTLVYDYIKNSSHVIWMESSVDLLTELRRSLNKLTNGRNTGDNLSEDALINVFVSEIDSDKKLILVFNNLNEDLKNKKLIEKLINTLNRETIDYNILVTQNGKNNFSDYSSLKIPDQLETDEASTFLDSEGFKKEAKYQIQECTKNHPFFLSLAMSLVRNGSANLLNSITSLDPKKILGNYWHQFSERQKDILYFCAHINHEEFSANFLERIFTVADKDFLQSILFELKDKSTDKFCMHTLWVNALQKIMLEEARPADKIIYFVAKITERMRSIRESFALFNKTISQDEYVEVYQHTCSLYNNLLSLRMLEINKTVCLELVEEIVWFRINILRDINGARELLETHGKFFKANKWMFYHMQLGLASEREEKHSQAKASYEIVLRRLSEDQDVEGEDTVIAKWHYFNSMFKIGNFPEEEQVKEAKRMIKSLHGKNIHNKIAHYYLLKYYILLGNIQQKKGSDHHADAEKNYKKAINIANTGFPNITPIRLLASLYHDSGRYEEAMQLLKQLEQTIKIWYGESHAEMGHVLNEMGNVLLSQGQIAESLDCYKKSHEIYNGYKMRENLAKAETNLGFVHFANKDFVKARKNFENSIMAYYEGDTHYRLTFTHYDFSKLLFCIDEIDSAIEHRERALEVGRQHFQGELQKRVNHFFMPSIEWHDVPNSTNLEKSKKLYDLTCQIYGEEHPETYENEFYYLQTRILIPASAAYGLRRKKSNINVPSHELSKILQELCQLLEKIYSINKKYGFPVISSSNIDKVKAQIKQILINLSHRQDGSQKAKRSERDFIKIEGITIQDINLSSMDLEAFRFENCKFKKVEFRNASLKLAVFPYCEIEDCNFTGAEFEKTDWTNIVLRNCTFDNIAGQPILPKGLTLETLTNTKTIDRLFLPPSPLKRSHSAVS